MIIDKILLDELQLKAHESERLRFGYDLRNDSEEDSQRMLNVLEPGTQVPIHRHTSSSETCLLLRGRIDEMFYDENGYEIERFHLDPMKGRYGVQIPTGTWHTIEVFEPSVIIEVKAGHYAPLTPNDIIEK